MNPHEIKKDFPIFVRQINGNALIYLDNAATSQKPREVLESEVDFYSQHNANVHRGIHTLSEEATELFEHARKTVADFIGAPHSEEIIFTKGATESLNRVAFEYALENVKPGDEIITTEMEHHSNLIPWQVVAQRTGAVLKLLEINDQGELSLEDAQAKITSKTKIVALTHASNVLGTINPVKEIAKLAHVVGAVVVVDGAQAIPHLKVNVESLDVDFYAFSGHKMLGPTGIGVLWGKKSLLEKIEPYEYGGGMIEEVTYQKSTWAALPEKFEAGTPNVAGAIGLAAAIKYLEKVGMENIRAHEVELNKAAISALQKIPGLRLVGPLDPAKRTGLVSFILDDVHAHDVAAVLNSEGIAVRSGHHCTMPLHKKLNLPATIRASWYLYNSLEDVRELVSGVEKAKELMGK